MSADAAATTPVAETSSTYPAPSPCPAPAEATPPPTSTENEEESMEETLQTPLTDRLRSNVGQIPNSIGSLFRDLISDTRMSFKRNTEVIDSSSTLRTTQDCFPDKIIAIVYYKHLAKTITERFLEFLDSTINGGNGLNAVIARDTLMLFKSDYSRAVMECPDVDEASVEVSSVNMANAMGLLIGDLDGKLGVAQRRIRRIPQREAGPVKPDALWVEEVGLSSRILVVEEDKRPSASANDGALFSKLHHYLDSNPFLLPHDLDPVGGDNRVLNSLLHQVMLALEGSDARSFFYYSGIEYVHGVLVPCSDPNRTGQFYALISDPISLDSEDSSLILLLASCFYDGVAQSFNTELGDIAEEAEKAFMEESISASSYNSSDPRQPARDLNNRSEAAEDRVTRTGAGGDQAADLDTLYVRFDNHYSLGPYYNVDLLKNLTSSTSPRTSSNSLSSASSTSSLFSDTSPTTSFTSPSSSKSCPSADTTPHAFDRPLQEFGSKGQMIASR